MSEVTDRCRVCNKDVTDQKFKRKKISRKKQIVDLYGIDVDKDPENSDQYFCG